MRAIVIALALSLVTSTCLADTIVLKDGRQLQGKVVARSRNKIAIKTDAGKLVMVKSDEVAEIVEGRRSTAPAKPEAGAEQGRRVSRVTRSRDGKRVGLAETFDSKEGWVPGRYPDRPEPQLAPRSMRVVDGELIVQTALGTLANLPKSFYESRGITPRSGRTVISKWFSKVDLTRYHYLAARMPKSQAGVQMWFCGKLTKVFYTTGLHVEDLRDLGLKGVHRVWANIHMRNNTGRVVLDDFRLVDRLAPDEQKALIPRGHQLRPQNLRAHPYQGLATLYDRGRAPLTELLKSEEYMGGAGRGEWARFRGQATHAPMLKLTRYPGSDSLQFAHSISPNGRWLIFTPTGRLAAEHYAHAYDLRERRVVLLPKGRHYFLGRHGNRTLQFVLKRGKEGGRITMETYDLLNGAATTILDQRVDELPGGQTEVALSGSSDRVALGTRGHDLVYLIDPNADSGARLRAIRVPYPIKGLSLTGGDRFLSFANAFTSHSVLYDYEAKKEYLRCTRFLGGGGAGHAAIGGGLYLGPYWGTVKLLAPALDMTDTPGDTIKIHSHYYKSEAPVDYGTISPDGRWAFCTGAGADVDGLIVGFELHEPGNVVPIYFHNTSRVGWDVKEYVYVTPDSTKIIQYCSDMLGDGDMYVVFFQRPEPPRDIRVDDTEEGLTVSWRPPRQSKEVWAYNVYHSMGRTTGFEKVNPRPVENTRFVHRGADPRSVYLVAAVDNCRLESRLPAPAMLPDRSRDDAVCVFFEAELADDVALPFRRQYDGYACNFGTMRVMPERPEEIEGRLEFSVPRERLHASRTREYGVALRGRLRSDIYTETGRKGATAEVIVDGERRGQIPAAGGRDLKWIRMANTITLSAGDHDLLLQSRSPGLDIDRVAIFSSEADLDWLEASPTDAEPETTAPMGPSAETLSLAPDGPYAMKLTWPSYGPQIGHYSVYSSTEPTPRPSNETLVGSTATTRFRDCGLRPATTLHYRVVGYDSRGRSVVEYRGQGTTDSAEPLPPIVLSPANAQLNDGMELVREGNHALVRIRQNAKTRKDYGQVRFPLRIPRTGDYAIWFYNRPHHRSTKIAVMVDKHYGYVDVERYMIPGCNVGEMGRRRGPEKRWYVNRIVTRSTRPQRDSDPRGAQSVRVGQDVFRLEAGQHTVTISMGIRINTPRSHDIGEIVVANDLTWLPPDYDPRTEFVREAPPASAR